MRLGCGGKPFALAEHHPALREMATARLHAPQTYWEKLHALPDLDVPPPPGAAKALARMMPETGVACRYAQSAPVRAGRS